MSGFIRRIFPLGNYVGTTLGKAQYGTYPFALPVAYVDTPVAPASEDIVANQQTSYVKYDDVGVGGGQDAMMYDQVELTTKTARP